MTPLFLGAFPIVTPPASNDTDISKQLTWVESQELMRGTLNHARLFISALDDEMGQSAFGLPRTFEQAPPLRDDHFPNPLLVSMPDPQTPLPVMPADSSVSTLSDDALYNLRLLFRRYFESMHPEIGYQYRAAKYDCPYRLTSIGIVSSISDS